MPPPSCATARAALVLSTFSIEPELSLLARAGFRIVGQNWTALREEGGKIAMLHLPGSVERLTPRPPGIVSAHETGTHRVDLNSEYCGSSCEMAWCDAVIVIAPGRRPLPHLRITQANAVGVLRRSWPIAELHPHRRQGQLPARIAQKCRVFDAQLSRNPQDILSLMETARYQRLHHPFRRRRHHVKANGPAWWLSISMRHTVGYCVSRFSRINSAIARSAAESCCESSRITLC